MSAPPTLLMEDVSDTARWVAFHRALESERPDVLFIDPFARRLAGERGRRIAEGMATVAGAHPGPRGLASPLAVRTKAFDEMILDSVQSIGAAAVLNLAAGLDARPYRLPLPSSLVWIEADRASILDEKAEALASAKPGCIVERVAVDLADDQARESLFDRVAGSHTRVVVVTEGLLVYLDEARVAIPGRWAPCATVHAPMGSRKRGARGPQAEHASLGQGPGPGQRRVEVRAPGWLRLLPPARLVPDRQAPLHGGSTSPRSGE